LILGAHPLGHLVTGALFPLQQKGKSLTYVYWTHCIPTYKDFCKVKEKLFIVAGFIFLSIPFFNDH